MEEGGKRREVCCYASRPKECLWRREKTALCGDGKGVVSAIPVAEGDGKASLAKPVPKG